MEKASRRDYFTQNLLGDADIKQSWNKSLEEQIKVMDGRYPSSVRHRRLESVKNRPPIQSPHSAHHWSNDVPMATRSNLPRSKSDMDMSRVLLKVPSSSQLSYNPPPSSRSEIFSQHSREGKQGGMKSLILKSSTLLHKRRSSNKLRSFEWQENDARSSNSSKHMTLPGFGKQLPLS